MRVVTDPFLKYREESSRRREFQEGSEAAEDPLHVTSRGTTTKRLVQSLSVVLALSFLVASLLEQDFFQTMIGVKSNVTLEELLEMIHM